MPGRAQQGVLYATEGIGLFFLRKGQIHPEKSSSEAPSHGSKGGKKKFNVHWEVGTLLLQTQGMPSLGPASIPQVWGHSMWK